MIVWELTIANTVSVEQVGQNRTPQGYEEVTTDHHEQELDFKPQVGVETTGRFYEDEDPDTGDQEFDFLLMDIVKENF